jgi:hypothetical protein
MRNYVSAPEVRSTLWTTFLSGSSWRFMSNVQHITIEDDGRLLAGADP